MKYYVYIYYDPYTQLPFYVGKGSGARMFAHLKSCKNNPRMENKINKLSRVNQTPIIEIYADELDEDSAYLIEEILISTYGRKYYDKGGILLNICCSAHPPNILGYKHTEDTKQKISASHKNREPMSIASRNKISNAHKGRQGTFKGCSHTEDAKQKISKALTGRTNGRHGKTIEEIYGPETANKVRISLQKPLSYERKRKISQSHQGITTYSKIIQTPNGLYDSAKLAAESYNRKIWWIMDRLKKDPTNFYYVGKKVGSTSYLSEG